MSESEAVPRRKVGSIESPVLISWRIETSTRERVKELAKLSGMSSSAFVDQMVANLPLTDQGIPSWVPPLDRDGGSCLSTTSNARGPPAEAEGPFAWGGSDP